MYRCKTVREGSDMQCQGGLEQTLRLERRTKQDNMTLVSQIIPRYRCRVEQPRGVIIECAKLVLEYHIDNICRRLQQQRQTLVSRPPRQYLPLISPAPTTTTNRQEPATNLVHSTLSSISVVFIESIQVPSKLNQLLPIAPRRHDEMRVRLHSS